VQHLKAYEIWLLPATRKRTNSTRSLKCCFLKLHFPANVI